MGFVILVSANFLEIQEKKIQEFTEKFDYHLEMFKILSVPFNIKICYLTSREEGVENPFLTWTSLIQ